MNGLICAKELSNKLNNKSRNIAVVSVLPNRIFEKIHIRYSLNIEPEELVIGVGNAPGILPVFDKLLKSIAKIHAQTDIESTEIIVYDLSGGTSAARLIWILELFGIYNWKYLDGGLNNWYELGFETTGELMEDNRVSAQIKLYKEQLFDKFNANYNKHLVEKEYIQEKLDNKNTLLIDARSNDEYTGKLCYGIRAGHIPRAINIPHNYLLNEKGLLKKPDEIKEIFKAGKLDLNQATGKEIIVYCQTHNRSALTYMCLSMLGHKNRKAYAGSWSQWSSDTKCEIES